MAIRDFTGKSLEEIKSSIKDGNVKVGESFQRGGNSFTVQDVSGKIRKSDASQFAMAEAFRATGGGLGSDTFQDVSLNARAGDANFQKNVSDGKYLQEDILAGKYTPNTDLGDNIQKQYGNVASNISEDARKMYEDQISALQVDNNLLSQQRVSQQQNYTDNLNRINTDTKNTLEKVDTVLTQKVGQIQNQIGSMGGDTSFLQTAPADVQKNLVAVFENPNFSDEQKMQEVEKMKQGFVQNGSSDAMLSMDWNKAFSMADEIFAGESSSSAILRKMEQNSLANVSFAKTDLVVNAMAEMKEQSVLNQKAYEETLLFLADSEKGYSAFLSEKAESDKSFFDAQKNQMEAEKANTLEDMGKQRARMEGVNLALLDRMGLASSSYGMKQMSANLSAFSAKMASVSLQYDGAILNLAKSQQDAYFGIQEKIFESQKAFKANVLELGQKNREYQSSIKYKAYRTAGEAEIDNLKDLGAFATGLASAKKAQEKAVEDSIKEAQGKMQKEAERFTKETGVVYVVKGGEVVPLQASDGSVLENWDRRQDRMKVLNDVWDLPARVENFEAWKVSAVQTLNNAKNTGIISSYDFEMAMNEVKKTVKNEVFAQQLTKKYSGGGGSSKSASSGFSSSEAGLMQYWLGEGKTPNQIIPLVASAIGTGSGRSEKFLNMYASLYSQKNAKPVSSGGSSPFSFGGGKVGIGGGASFGSISGGSVGIGLGGSSASAVKKTPVSQKTNLDATGFDVDDATLDSLF